jgi:hypothetical protein
MKNGIERALNVTCGCRIKRSNGFDELEFCPMHKTGRELLDQAQIVYGLYQENKIRVLPKAMHDLWISIQKSKGRL